MNLTEFLLARIAEDEEMWTMARDGGMVITVHGQSAIPPQSWTERQVAECEAKRRIVGEHELLKSEDDKGVGCDRCDWDREWGMPNTGGCDTLRFLALPHADHPDYREEWKP